MCYYQASQAMPSSLSLCSQGLTKFQAPETLQGKAKISKEDSMNQQNIEVSGAVLFYEDASMMLEG